MSYTPPSGTATDFWWAGENAYTAPSGSATDFLQPSNGVMGFSSLNFGTPVVPPKASGFATLTFGTPATPLRVTGIAPATVVSAPYRKVNLTFALVGFTATTFARPSSFGIVPMTLNRTFGVPGLFETRVGAPVATQERFFAASGFHSPNVGSPKAAMVRTAAGFALGVLGAPTLGLRLKGKGVWVTSLGHPAAGRTQPAVGFQRTARFGVARAWRSRTYLTYSIDASNRVGQPLGYSRFNYGAQGFTGGAFGAPASQVSNHAMLMPPCARFGRPLLKRNATC